MAKKHINPNTGRIGSCSATIKCKFAKDGQIPPHYDTEQEAQAALDEALSVFAVPTALKRGDDRATLTDTISSGPLFDELEASVKKKTSQFGEDGLLTDEAYAGLKEKREALRLDVQDARAEFNTAKEILANFSNSTVDDPIDAEWSAKAESLGNDFDNANVELNKAIKEIGLFQVSHMRDMEARENVETAKKSSKLSKEEYAMLHNERGDLEWNVNAAQAEADEAADVLTNFNGMIEDGVYDENDVDVRHRKSSFERDLEHQENKVSQIREKLGHFNEQHGSVMKAYVTENGEYDWQQELMNGYEEKE